MRKFHRINWDQMNKDLQTDVRLQLAASHIEVNNISEYLVGASTETKETIRQRDLCLERMKMTNNNNDICHYKTLCNKVHKLLRNDKIKSIKDNFDENDGNSRKTWKMTKQTAGWTKNLSPNLLSVKGVTISDPKGIAGDINVAQITRNIKLHRQVPTTNTDHKTNYKKLIKNKNLQFTLRKISMGELLNSVKETKPTPSAGVDGISIKTI